MYRLLLIDDEEAVLNALRRELQDPVMYEIVTCTDPLKALDQVQQQEFAVVISDFRMPTLEGLDVLQKIQQRRPDAIRILMSGHNDLQMLIDAMNKAHVFSFISKPWDGTKLRDTIAHAVHEYDLRTQAESLKQKIEQQEIALAWHQSQGKGLYRN